MKHLIIGDVHGNFGNLREFLIEQGAIDEHNRRINKDTLKVYCSGDLIDGHYNRQGDLMLLALADQWFDKIAIGNHEWSFCGGMDFGGCRRHDRDIILGVNQLIAREIYVPAFVVEDYLVVHAGLADRWGFYTAQDACEAIQFAWDNVKAEDDENLLFDGIGPLRAGKFADECGGIFWCDWEEPRNRKINQIVGHSTYPEGPLCMKYHNSETEHWNIDVGGKTGLCLGGVVIENGTATPVFWGQRFRFKSEWEDSSENSDSRTPGDAGSDEEYDEILGRIADELLQSTETYPQTYEEEAEEVTSEIEALDEAWRQEMEAEDFEALMQEPSHYDYLGLLEERRK